ncbi:NAD-binding protein [Schizopora paradoxa]|uniref:NAD-binding protein n=1 Tax=Schizopora paradoxa TaxID=27342 RepID=A0A0H2S473_9AGAM|nr:NAD-binding protein [Schizopora paradoxa]
MSAFKNFAVAGAGNLGHFIITELLQLKKNGAISTVKVLTRTGGSKYPELVELGATFVEVQYEDPASLKKALAGTEVVISTIGGTGLATQAQLANASKDAGVQLFVPSEFGNPTDGKTDHAIFSTKDSTKKHLRELGLPFAAFYTGPFPDFVLKPQNGKAAFGGSGDVPISWTSMPDIARFVSHVLTTLPKKELEWRIFRIEGDRQSFNNIIASYEQRTGTKLEVTKRSRAELEATLKENPSDFVTFLLWEWDLGGGITGKPEELSNNLWPEWNPKSVVDVAIEGIPIAVTLVFRGDDSEPKQQ